MSQNLVLFVALAVVVVVSAVGVIATRHVMRSALSLVVNFFTLGILYLGMNLHLIGIGQILVYTGLIMMLFLFCILLLNLGAPQMLYERSPIKVWAAVLVSGALIVIVLSQVFLPMTGAIETTAPDDYGRVRTVGNWLFNKWVYGFEISSVLLLVGIVGSILVAKRRG
ncbi:MAG: NADH-quinone oxidoreductase subunit J [Armatimonadetes bacterium]|nr:NADH-quinone oxidoreductase subunit J [Armatimonadota bacterium]